MKVSKNEDGSITLTPETSESAAFLEYLATLLKQKIEAGSEA